MDSHSAGELIDLIAFLSIAGTLLTLPNIDFYYGLSKWAVAHTGGVVDVRFIALVDTALESPLGQIAMIPMGPLFGLRDFLLRNLIFF